MAKQTKREQNQMYRKKMAAVGAWHADLKTPERKSFLIVLMLILAASAGVHFYSEADGVSQEQRTERKIIGGISVFTVGLGLLWALVAACNRPYIMDAVTVSEADKLKQAGLTQKDLDEIANAVHELHLEYLSEIDPEYINGLIKADLNKNGKISLHTQLALDSVIRGYLMAHPGDYQKIVNALKDKHPIFSEKNLSNIKFDADFNMKIRKEDAEKQARKSAKLAALKTAKIKRMFGIKQRAK